MTDKDIVTGILNRKEDALIDLKNNYGRLLYGVINKILSSFCGVMDIEECFNDALMSIWENIDCYDETKGELRNFLISVAKFRALDYKRKISKQKINLELKDEIYKDTDDIQIDDEGFYKLIENLKEKDKVIFVKKYLLDESVEKIAKDINMAKDTVYKRLMRGREKIKEYIEN